MTPEKHEAAIKFANSRGLTPLDNLLLPRTTGFVSTVQAMRNGPMTAVYDFTFAYIHKKNGMIFFGDAPSLLRIHSGKIDDEYAIHTHVKRYPMSSLPIEEKDLQTWLYKRWEEKDKLMGHLRDKWTEGLTLLNEPWLPVFDSSLWDDTKKTN